MALLAADIGEREMLDMILKDTTPEAQIVRLYSNDYDAVEGSVAGDFTEVVGGGYAAKTLTRGSWNAASTDGGGVTSATYAAQTWSWTGAATVVGYFVVGATSGSLLWAERLYAGAGQVFGNGDSLTVTPKL